MVFTVVDRTYKKYYISVLLGELHNLAILGSHCI
jgi:hypothetical protein